MIHGQKTNKLSRERNVRNALLKTLAVSLIREGKIKTTEAKAKTLKPIVEKLVTKAKIGDLSAQRFITSKIGPTSTKKLINTIAIKYKERNGGYLRIIKLNDRKNDSAKIVLLEFV